MIKKLLIGASALTFATIAQAQVVTDLKIGDTNTATVGANFDAAVLQANNPPSSGANIRTQANTAAAAMPNAALITLPVAVSVTLQNGQLNPLVSGNKAGIEQDGNANLGEVNQDSGKAGWGAINQLGQNNDGIIDQRDSSNGGFLSASVNSAFISQVSPDNTASGNKQLARINQVHTGSGFIQNAVILQGGRTTASDGTQGGQSNNSTITQTGKSSGLLNLQNALSVQTGRDNASTITQVGTSNKATTVQDRKGSSLVDQNGTDNQSYVVQGGGSELKFSSVKQNGVNNFAAVSQASNLDADSFIEQSGNDNQAFVKQSGDDALSTIKQEGTGGKNFASVYQTSAEDLYSSILQKGSVGSNEAYVYQHNANGSASVIAQDGGNNYAVARQ